LSPPATEYNCFFCVPLLVPRRSRLGFLIFSNSFWKEKNQKTQPNYCPYLFLLSVAEITAFGFNILSFIFCLRSGRAITAQKNGRYMPLRPELVVRLTQACIQADQVAILIYIYIIFSTFSLPYLFGVTLSSRAFLVTEGFEAEETIRSAGSLIRYTLLG